MSQALIRRSRSGGLVPAIASWCLPGLGQIINNDPDKALGVFAVFLGAGLASQIPLVGGLAAVVSGGTWLYGVVDGYRGRRSS